MIVDEIQSGDGTAVYAEGWQSWSPVGWCAPGGTLDGPRDRVDAAMRFRRWNDSPQHGIRAEGLLVVDGGDGSPLDAYVAVDPSREVPTITAEHRGERLIIESDAPVRHWQISPRGDARSRRGEVLRTIGARLGAGLHARVDAPPRRVWCSWYRYFESVTAADIVENTQSIARLGLPIDVIQIDDGWGSGVGEGARTKARFGSLEDTVKVIHDGGFGAGLWLAPFVIGRHSSIARQHSEWLSDYAGYNWGDELVGLDLTSGAVRGYLESIFARLKGMGVDYLKLDFLYAGAISPQNGSADKNGIAAYRSGLELIRNVMGDRTYILGCGAPLLPSIGLVDAMRISSDVFHEGGESGVDGIRGLQAMKERAWQDNLLWTTDPDCLVASPTYRLRDEWARLVFGAPGTRSFSDRVGDLDAHGRSLVTRLLGDMK